MKEKNKKWLKDNKKDLKILLVIFVIAFMFYLITTQDILNSLWLGFVWVILGAILINAFRYLRKWFRKLLKL